MGTQQSKIQAYLVPRTLLKTVLTRSQSFLLKWYDIHDFLRPDLRKLISALLLLPDALIIIKKQCAKCLFDSIIACLLRLKRLNFQEQMFFPFLSQMKKTRLNYYRLSQVRFQWVRFALGVLWTSSLKCSIPSSKLPISLLLH